MVGAGTRSSPAASKSPAPIQSTSSSRQPRDVPRAHPGGESCMSQRIVPAVATFLGICAFISITMYSVYLNAMPQYLIECTGCGSCAPGANCNCLYISEDINLWGMVQKINSLTLIAYVI